METVFLTYKLTIFLLISHGGLLLEIIFNKTVASSIILLDLTWIIILIWLTLAWILGGILLIFFKPEYTRLKIILACLSCLRLRMFVYGYYV